MRLIHFLYKEEKLVFKPVLPFQEISFLFDRNAAGKLKAMEVVNLTISYILRTVALDNKSRFSSSLTFEDEGETIIYSISVSEGKITAEEFGFANKSALHVHCDAQQDLYIEKIRSWAEHTHALSFNKTDTGLNRTSISSTYHRSLLFIMIKSISEASLNKVISQAHQLGYHISSTGTIEHDELHVLYLLIYMEYISLRTKPSLLLINNLYEAFDYDRSIQLGRLLFSFCLKHGIQLIVNSNNTFLINVLELKYWNIMLRKEI